MSTYMISLAQINPLVGDIEGNTQRVLFETKKALDSGANCIVFPELTLCGYPPEDLLLRPSMQKRIDNALSEICEQNLGIAIILGYPKLVDQHLYNMAGLVNHGQLVFEYAKQCLPNYQVFDEKRYFSPGDAPGIFDLDGIRFGLSICEDIWDGAPLTQYEGIDLLINLNASPYHQEKQYEREALIGRRARQLAVPIVYVNQVGGQDELVFDGGTMACHSNGDIAYRSEMFTENLSLVSFDSARKTLSAHANAAVPATTGLASIYQALVLGVKDYVNKNRFKGVILGLSGGIDSALTLAIRQFIDVLPYNNDAADLSSGLASMRDPGSTFSGIYEVSKLTPSSVGETFYATTAVSNTISPDPCHEDNHALNYVPMAGDFCYDFYVRNGNAFAGGATEGTGIISWVECTSLDPVVCGGLANDEITALLIIAPAVTADGGKTLKIELTPTGNVGGTPDIDADSNVTGSSTGDIYTNTFSGRIREISLNVISNDVSVTIVSGSIGDTVYFDANGNGVQDGGEVGIPNVELALEDDMGNPIYVDPLTGGVVPSAYPGAMPYVVTTDSSGNYSFNNLPADDYVVIVNQSTLPAGLIQTADPDSALDSQSSHSLAAITDPFGVVTEVEDNVDQDFGYFQPTAQLGDTVWFDLDQDGVQDSGEPGVTGVTVHLIDNTGMILETTTTDGSGNYLFDDLTPGIDYAIRVELPTSAPFQFSPQDSGSATDQTDSDVNTTSGESPTTQLGSNESDLTLDAGIFAPGIEPGSISNFIWFDANEDGIQDGSETGVSGVTVNLLDENGMVIATTVTDSNGEYIFEGLIPGDYAIGVVEPTGLRLTTQDATADDADSDIDPATKVSDTITLGSGEDITTLDAGLTSGVALARLGDTVWYDADGDGIQDGNENGVPGVEVELFDVSGNSLGTVLN